MIISKRQRELSRRADRREAWHAARNAALVWLLIAAVLISVGIAVTIGIAHGDEITCASARGHDGRYWAFREIAGRRCWYAGPRGMAKARLAWRTKRPLPGPSIPAAPIGLTTGVLPPVGPPGPASSPRDQAPRSGAVFDDMWNDRVGRDGTGR